MSQVSCLLIAGFCTYQKRHRVVFGCQLLATSGSDFRHALLCRQHLLSPTRLQAERQYRLLIHSHDSSLRASSLYASWLLVAPIRQGVGANQQRKTPNGANPFPPTRLETVPSFVIPRTLRCCCNSAQSPCVLMKKVGPTKTPQKNQHEINHLWQLLTTPPSYTFFKNVQSLFHIVDYSQHSTRPLIKEPLLRWR